MDLVMIPQKLLVFRRPSRRDGEHGGRKSCLHMVVHNPTDDWMLFKFRTNANGNVMGLRPALGFIRPQDHVDIKANLNLDHFTQETGDLKVLVVSCRVDSTIAQMDLKLAWQLIPRDRMRFKKLDCVYRDYELQGESEKGYGCFLEGEPAKQDKNVRACQYDENATNWGQPSDRSNQAVKLPGAVRCEIDEAKNATKLQQPKYPRETLIGQASNYLPKWSKSKKRRERVKEHVLEPSCRPETLTSSDVKNLEPEDDPINCTPLRIALSFLICLALLIYLKF